VLGQDALLRAEEEGTPIVSRQHLITAARSLASSQYAVIFSDKYQTAFRDSYYREVVLRAFSHWDERDIPTSEVYRTLRSKLGVKHPAPYKGHLGKDPYGRIFLRAPYRDRGMVRFANDVQSLRPAA
jgi:hypothetical protein